MFSKIKIALAAVVLSIAFPAMAATKHRVTERNY
jgi:Tfp pilus assembly protein FimT